MTDKTNGLHGVIVPAVTPIDEDERVDEAAFRAHLRRLIDAGVHGLFVGGSSGEGPLLADPEWKRMAAIARDEVKDDVPLLGGVAETSTRRSITRIEHLGQLGYRYFVATPTFYVINTNPAEHLRHFQACHRHAGDMELIAYNIPSCVGSSIPLEVMLRLAGDGCVRTCKESSDDPDYLMHLLRLGRESGLRVLAGYEPGAPGALAAGAVGLVPVCGNFAPNLLVSLYDAAMAGEAETARLLHERLMWLRDRTLLCGACWLGGAKMAASLQGYGNGRVVAPLEPPNAEQRSGIEDALRSLDLL